jgi:hypothetical protein
VTATRAFVLLAAFGACSDAPTQAPAQRAQPAKRIIEPPKLDELRVVAPIAIRSTGIGPFLVGEKTSALLPRQRDGARVQRFDIPNVVRTGLMRFEEDQVLVGGEPGTTATFVAVVSREMAQTENGGVHVGSTGSELEAAHGPRASDPYIARDPRLAVMTKLPNVRAVLDSDRIIAFVVAADPVTPTLPPSEHPACERPPLTATTMGLCFTHAGEVVERIGDDLTVKSADGTRTYATLTVPSLRFVAPLRVVEDGLDDLVAVSASYGDDGARRWSIAAYRLEPGRLVKVAEADPAFEVTSEEMRWVGADLTDVSMYFELAAQVGSIAVSGVITTMKAGKVRDVGVISELAIARRAIRSGPPSKASDAPPDALPAPEAAPDAQKAP